MQPRLCCTCHEKQTYTKNARCRECNSAYNRAWAAKNPGRKRELRRAANLRQYGLTPGAYGEMLKGQGGGCAICGQVPGDTLLAVDHDHSCCPGLTSCGKCVRGLLCINCNNGLGRFQDNPLNVYAAFTYLIEHSERSE